MATLISEDRIIDELKARFDHNASKFFMHGTVEQGQFSTHQFDEIILFLEEQGFEHISTDVNPPWTGHIYQRPASGAKALINEVAGITKISIKPW